MFKLLQFMKCQYHICALCTDVHEEGDTTPEYQPPEIPDMDIKPMMKGKEDFRLVDTRHGHQTHDEGKGRLRVN